ncbi:MAG: AsmA-like C-terminal region-containing protein [Bacteroidales bacterium]|nr:AsmA-like C-terminal region-containing protein [Bacteroidales bacterium]
MNFNGKFDETVKLRDFSFNLNESDFLINCNILNVNGFLHEKDKIYAEAEIKSTVLDLGHILVQKTDGDSSEFINFPEGVSFRANFSVDQFIYGRFKASEIAGAVTYQPKVFTVHSFQLKSVDGNITGVADISQNQEKITKIECSADLKGIDIRKLFYSFNNFAQEVILDQNLEGKLSGKVNISSSWDKNIVLLNKSIEAYTDIQIENGELVNYAPMLGLSKFISVDELKDIKFNTLSNQIIIRDEIISIPEMDIRSSAFNIKGSGVHKFDNSYEYVIQVKLSDLLAKKARKKKKEIDEFGIVEEDGLGLVIPVKIVGKGNDFDVAFDRKKAFSIFKKNVADERQEFKNLIKEDKQVTNQQTKEDNQNKEFIIDWEEGNDKKEFIFEPEEKNQKKNKRIKNRKQVNPSFLLNGMKIKTRKR